MIGNDIGSEAKRRTIDDVLRNLFEEIKKTESHVFGVQPGLEKPLEPTSRSSKLDDYMRRIDGYTKTLSRVNQELGMIWE